MRPVLFVLATTFSISATAKVICVSTPGAPSAKAESIKVSFAEKPKIKNTLLKINGRKLKGEREPAWNHLVIKHSNPSQNEEYSVYVKNYFKKKWSLGDKAEVAQTCGEAAAYTGSFSGFTEGLFQQADLCCYL